MRQLDDLKATVASLHAGLCVDEYKLSRERNLLVQLEKAEDELRPLHEVKAKNLVEKFENLENWKPLV